MPDPKPTPTELIFTAWNAHKGEGYIDGDVKIMWKSHKKNRRGEISKEIKDAINLRLRDYDLEDILEAIDNYAMVLLSKDYTWRYVWALTFFLTRHRPGYRTELQLLRWLPDYFNADDYLPQQDRQPQQPESAFDKMVKEER